jgi:hypothetical protein
MPITPASPFALPFDVWHPDGLVFDDQPDLFLTPNVEPLVFTVRGIGYFGPRFTTVGVEIATVQSLAQFNAAYQRWLEVERVLLQEKVAGFAAGGRSLEHAALQAVIDGDVERFAHTVKRLEHRRRVGLKVVSNC